MARPSLDLVNTFVWVDVDVVLVAVEGGEGTWLEGKILAMGLTIWDILLPISERLESFTAQRIHNKHKMKYSLQYQQQHQPHFYNNIGTLPLEDKQQQNQTHLSVYDDDVLIFQWHAVLPIGLG